MASLSNMSAEEISKMLDEYGIKHGPVVGEWLGPNNRSTVGLLNFKPRPPAPSEV